MKRANTQWKDDLEPYARAWYEAAGPTGEHRDAAAAAVLAMIGDNPSDRVYDAALRCTTTNCWYATYAAAQVIRGSRRDGGGA